MKVKEKKEESGSEKAQGERNEKRSERSLKGEVEGNEREWFLLY